MAKILRGRLDGLWGMATRTSESLHDQADTYERRATNPAESDDPGWLRRWSNRMRCLAQQKAKARQHKSSQRRRV